MENEVEIPDMRQDAVMAPGDGDLQQLLEAWPTLDRTIKVKIMRLLRPAKRPKS